MNMNDLIGKQFIMKGLDLKSRKEVDKIVTLEGILDGPGSDRRDYCTISGYYNWEIDIPLENFERQAKLLIS